MLLRGRGRRRRRLFRGRRRRRWWSRCLMRRGRRRWRRRTCRRGRRWRGRCVRRRCRGRRRGRTCGCCRRRCCSGRRRWRRASCRRRRCRRALRRLLRFSIRADFALWLSLRDNDRRGLRMRCGACEWHRGESCRGKQHEAKLSHGGEIPGKVLEAKWCDQQLRVRPHCGGQKRDGSIYFCMRHTSKHQCSLRIQMHVAIA
jgi:hypothetical protein